MKKTKSKSISLRKITIAKIDPQYIFGGFVNPTEPTDDTECACESNVYCKDDESFIFIVPNGRP